MATKEKGNKFFHKLDKYIGIPIVFLLGLFRKKHELPNKIQKIAILNLGSIGDNVLMSGPIADLLSKYPTVKIDVFAGNSNFQLVHQISNLNEILRLPITNPLKTIKYIKNAGEYDIVFDFGPWPRLNAVYSYFFMTKYVVGFKTKGQHRHYVYDCVVEHRDDVHEIDNHRSLIKPLYQGENRMPHLELQNVSLDRLNIDFEAKICIIHPWSAGLRKSDKQWKNENWVNLCKFIVKDFEQLIITGAPSDVEDSNELLDLIKKSDESIPVISLAGQLSLMETSRLISLSSFIFCVDTGIAHVAAALSKPLICLQGPAKSIRWRPYSDNAIVINPSFGTFGYINLGFEKSPDNTNCMENISVESVIDAYEQYKRNNNFVK